ncbi:DNA-nicking Smr family endonuclease [Geothermobacter ehrlichii]|uniref:DNA-nicking Smr family endonuclease n=1 Tax=Geothermobacter ehrlichii TaxID=213224 RepID=A0A5D3WL50_9BACT|nr:Smr/MutS family protein [Geothermobacter ehrlichii]TYO99855.1 DNA-nicking Smr family endonuclease [Geothermobacter ehrlichii]
MARRKKARRTESGNPSFRTSPFSSLKGLAVSDDSPSAGAKAPASHPSPPAEEDFLQAMAGLGVKPLDGTSAVPPEPVMKPEAAQEPDAEPPEDERDLFLQALGRLDVRFEDEIPETPTPPAPRRMKQLVRGKLRIEAEIDLHGLTRDQALEKLEHFLGNAAYHGWRTVRVITGKGQHSADGPVLREAVEHLLRTRRLEAVIEWGRAPRQFGGGGALILFLRS